MRPIKFRAWDKSLEEMRYSINIPSDYTERNGDLDLINMFQALNQRYIFMQYTGLKDENGREIYEGDIVRHATWGDVYEVIFEDGGFYVLSSYDFQTINEYPLEVIGNIYENPKLL